MERLSKRHEQEVADLLGAVAYEGHVIRSRGWLLRIYGGQRIGKNIWRDLNDRWADTERPSGHNSDSLWIWYEPREGSAVIFLRQSPKANDNSGNQLDRSLMPIVRRCR